MTDDRSWTIKRPKRADGWSEWLFAHGFLLAAGGAIGAALGWWAPLLAAGAPGGRSLTRSAIRNAGQGALADGGNEDARARAVAGAVIGVMAGAGVAFAARRRPSRLGGGR